VCLAEGLSATADLSPGPFDHPRRGGTFPAAPEDVPALPENLPAARGSASGTYTFPKGRSAMLCLSVLPWLSLSMLHLAAVPPVELSSIDRSLRREPVYQSKAPHYALLVFGPRAEHRCWLVVDGDRLYLDRNGNGDLTEAGECLRCSQVLGTGPGAQRWFEGGDILLPDGQTKYTRLVIVYQVLSGLGQKDIHYCRVWLETIACQFAAARLEPRPDKAPILSFGGRLTLLPGAMDPTLTEGFLRGQECEIGVRVGTLGRGTSLQEGRPVAVTVLCQPPSLRDGLPRVSSKIIPEGIHPVAEIEFPSSKPGEEPIRVRVVLSRRC